MGAVSSKHHDLGLSNSNSLSSDGSRVLPGHLGGLKACVVVDVVFSAWGVRPPVSLVFSPNSVVITPTKREAANNSSSSGGSTPTPTPAWGWWPRCWQPWRRQEVRFVRISFCFCLIFLLGGSRALICLFYNWLFNCICPISKDYRTNFEILWKLLTGFCVLPKF